MRGPLVVAGVVVLTAAISVGATVAVMNSGDDRPDVRPATTSAPTATEDACASAMQELAGAQARYDQLPDYLKNTSTSRLSIDIANNHVAEYCR
jgi:hypothetical protein